MKKLILLLSSVILLFACQDDIISEYSDQTDTSVDAFTFAEEDILKGRIRVKLKEEPPGEVAVRDVNGTVTTGIDALDDIAPVLGITQIKRIFPPTGKFEERTRRKGMHLWYDIWFTADLAATRATGELAAMEEFEIVTPVVKVVSTRSPLLSTFETHLIDALRQSNELSFNDPDLPKQWNYYNPGTESWQEANADVRLIDVWQQYNGHPDIIVALVDGGIDLDHPDLKPNLWMNSNEIPDNGLDDDSNGYVDDIYGYNFVSGNATITPNKHGTHVAGIIGAANNNQIGVCGIAGGNGTVNSGVKLMSCQTFQHPGGRTEYEESATYDDIAAAIKYGADNGAVICQNSWGYSLEATVFSGRNTRSSYIDPAHKDAIDYFVEYAGCDNNLNQLPGSPMKGGIVLFASGNSNTPIPSIAAPADYNKVLGIAAIGPDYKKADYSNYGTYMDLSAPGGGKDIEEKKIWSTTMTEMGSYMYQAGTSMACPHVAGVAALVIQKHGVGKPGFTAAQLEEILLTTAYDISEYNPKYVGQLGFGCVNAAAALQADLPPHKPFSLASNPVTNGNLSFTVHTDLAGQAIIAIYNSTGNKILQKEIVTKRYVLFSLDIHELAAGYYTLQYECNEQVIKEKFIKY